MEVLTQILESSKEEMDESGREGFCEEDLIWNEKIMIFHEE